MLVNRSMQHGSPITPSIGMQRRLPHGTPPASSSPPLPPAPLVPPAPPAAPVPLLLFSESLPQLTESPIVTIARAKPKVCRSIVSSSVTAVMHSVSAQQFPQRLVACRRAQCCVREFAYHGMRAFEARCERCARSVDTEFALHQVLTKRRVYSLAARPDRR